MEYIEARIVRILLGLNQAVREIFGYDISRKGKMSIEGGSAAGGSGGGSVGGIGGGIGGGIEGGSVGAASVSGLSFVVPAFEAAPIGGSLSAIVKEGPFRGSLEGFRPMNVSDIHTIDKGGTIAPPSVIQQAETVAAAAWGKNELPTPAQAISQIKSILSQAHVDSVQEVVPITIPNGLKYPRPHVAVSPTWEVQPVLQQKTESRVSIQTTTATPTLPALKKQEVEEIVTEKVIKQETGLIEEEEITKEKRLYLVDENALTQRIHEIRQAINKARIEAKRLGLGESIDGSLIAKFMPAEHAGNRSRIVQPNGPDGSYEETKEAVRKGQFYSEDQVEDVVLENRPVKIGKDGKPVKNEDVWKVLKYRVFKRIPAHEVVISRVMKKKSSSGQNPTQIHAREKSKIEPRETSLEDYPELAEIFQD